MKLSSVNGVDPYETPEWSNDVKLLPLIEQEDIADYLVHRTSFYTRQAFKASKQLGAHNQHTSGWVKTVFTHNPRNCQNTIITAEVCFKACLGHFLFSLYVTRLKSNLTFNLHEYDYNGKYSLILLIYFIGLSK